MGPHAVPLRIHNQGHGPSRPAGPPPPSGAGLLPYHAGPKEDPEALFEISRCDDDELFREAGVEVRCAESRTKPLTTELQAASAAAGALAHQRALRRAGTCSWAW